MRTRSRGRKRRPQRVLKYAQGMNYRVHTSMTSANFFPLPLPWATFTTSDLQFRIPATSSSFWVRGGKGGRGGQDRSEKERIPPPLFPPLHSIFLHTPTPLPHSNAREHARTRSLASLRERFGDAACHACLLLLLLLLPGASPPSLSRFRPSVFSQG